MLAMGWCTGYPKEAKMMEQRSGESGLVHEKKQEKRERTDEKNLNHAYRVAIGARVVNFSETPIDTSNPRSHDGREKED
jgi:hypothetical protein